MTRSVVCPVCNARVGPYEFSMLHFRCINCVSKMDREALSAERSKITKITHVIPVELDVKRASEELAHDIGQAIAKAREAGLPQGLLVAIVHSFDHMETARMVEGVGE